MNHSKLLFVTLLLLTGFVKASNQHANSDWINTQFVAVTAIEKDLTLNPNIKLSQRFNKKVEAYYRELLILKSKEGFSTSKQSIEFEEKLLTILSHHDTKFSTQLNHLRKATKGGQPETGHILGRLNSTNSSNSIEDTDVRLYSLTGNYIATDYADSLGRFSFNNVATGSYLLMAAMSDDAFMTTLYQGNTCVGGLGQGCLPQDGTAVTVTANQFTEIEFNVNPLSIISGSIKDPEGNHESGYVNVYDSQFNLIDETYVSHNIQTFQIGFKYEGEVYLMAHNYDSLNQIYPNINCYDNCDITQGNSVTISSGQTSDVGEFTLKPYSKISGIVYDANTNRPITDTNYGDKVKIYDHNQNYDGYDYIDDYGQWGISTVPGDYYAVAAATNYHTTLYPDLICPNNSSNECEWNNTNTITHGYEHDTSIDFHLTPQPVGSISGRVTNHEGQASDIDIILYNAAGNYIGYQSVNNSFQYSFDNLTPGTYYILAENDSYYDFNGLGTLYGNHLCFDPSNYNDRCDDVTVGTAIQVAENQDVTGIDIQLIAGSKISGTVLTEGDSSTTINAYIQNDSNYYVFYKGVNLSPSETNYTLEGLVPGQYKIKAESSLHQSELYNNINCTDSDCEQSAGHVTQITHLNQHAQNRNFSLALLPTMQFNFSGLIDNGYLHVYDLNGNQIKSQSFSAGNEFIKVAIEPGSYRVLFDFYNDDAHPIKYFGGPNCFDVSECDASLGTVINISNGQNRVFNVNFDKKFQIDIDIDYQGNVGHVKPQVVTYKNNIEIGRYSGYSERTIYLPTTGNIKLAVELRGHYTQIYNGINCHNNCQITQGTNINAQLNQSRNIQMTLQPVFEIKGTIRDDFGSPVGNQRVNLHTYNGSYLYNLEYTYTDDDGKYSFIGSLNDETDYMVSANVTDTHLETYNGNLVCTDPCDPSTLQPFNLTAGQDKVINIKQKLKGVLSIENLQFINGTIASDVRVRAYTLGNANNYHTSYTDNDGNISSWPISLTSFKLAFYDDGITTVYPGILCQANNLSACLEQGQTIQLSAGQSQTISNAQVNSKGMLTVQTLDSNQQPIENIRVSLVNHDISIETSQSSDENGLVNFARLDELSYFVMAKSASGFQYATTLYPTTVCQGGVGIGCTLNDGSPVIIDLNQHIQINMTLNENPTANINLIDSFTTEVLPSFNLKIYDGSSNHISTLNASNNTALHLEPGQYYVLAERSGYHPVTWPHHLCSDDYLSECEDKTLITIGQQNNNFQLFTQKNSGFYFEVIDGETVTPIEDAIIDIWRNSNIYDSVSVNELGRGASNKSIPSYYELRFSTDIGVNNNIYNEVYNNIQCPEGPAAYALCNISQGEEVTIDTSVPFPPIIRFELNGDPIFSDSFEQ